MSAIVAMPVVLTKLSSTRRLHLLTLTPFFPSVQDPAGGCFIAEPMSRLPQFGIENHVIAVNPFYRARQQPRSGKTLVEWKNFLCLPGNLGLASAGIFLAKAVLHRVNQLHRSSPIDLIHAHAALPCGAAAMLLAKQLEIPFVVSVHGLDVFAEKQAGRFLEQWTRRASMRVYREATRVLCISEKVRQQLARDLRQKTQIIYNGVDTELFAASGETSSRLKILSVGNLIAIKGHALLLKAFAEVLKTISSVELEIIGDGPERGNLVQLADTLGIGSRVRFRGRQSRETVAAAMQNCTVFVLPSRYEALGCVYLEAMSCGKPAIGCFGQGIDEIIDHGRNGLLVAPGDGSALSETLRAVLQDASLRRRLGTAARDTVLQRFTLEHQAQQLSELYQECAA